MRSDKVVYRDYLSEWLKGRRYNINSQTYKVSESLIRNQINPSLGDLTLSQLNPMVLQEFFNGLRDKGLADNTVRRIYSVVFSSLEMAYKMELIPRTYL